MRHERSFVAARPLAQHCAELVRSGSGGGDGAAELAKIAARFARALAPALGPHLGGKGTTVTARPAQRTSLGDYALLAPVLSADCLLALGDEALPVLLSLDAAAVLRMVDRTFGGRGTAPSPLPAEFPGSADLLIGKLEQLVAHHLAAAVASARPPELTPLRRATSLTELDAVAPDQMLTVLEFDVTEPGGTAWTLAVGLPDPALAALTGPVRPEAATPPRPADPLSAPFAGLPLELSAVLVDMAVPLATLAALRPGALLPVAVARQVPLRLGEMTIAAGNVGAADDRVALQLTHAFQEPRP